MTQIGPDCPSTREAVEEWEEEHHGDGCPICGRAPEYHFPEETP